jgi:6-phosphogluconolactonase (cycloisomerase 2 family)
MVGVSAYSAGKLEIYSLEDDPSLGSPYGEDSPHTEPRQSTPALPVELDPRIVVRDAGKSRV